MVVIDLFSGAGGLTEGFVREGFDVVAHVEKEKWACETLKTRVCYHYLKANNDLDLYFSYLKNSNNYHTIDKDRQIIFDEYPELKDKLDAEVLNKTFGNPDLETGVASTQEIINLIEKSIKSNNKSTVDVIIGGPPCQAYSLIGRGRMWRTVKDDKRNFLFYYYKDIVDYFKPSVFVFENVPGILTAQQGRIFSQIQEEFNDIGYTLLSGPDPNHSLNILDASDFGVYQSRKRMILFGFRSNLNLAYPEFSKYAVRLDEEQITRNAIDDLPFLRASKGTDFYFGEYKNTDSKKLSQFQMMMRKDSPGIVNHKARSIIDQDAAIYRLAIERAKKGKQLRYCQIPQQYSTHKNKDSFEDRFSVHWWSDLPHTIVAHISKDGHYNIHPDMRQCRSLTVREAARIQSFPDNYKFEGPRTWQFTQVGNAVPPLMAQAIAGAIKEECFINPRNTNYYHDNQLTIEEVYCCNG